MRRGFTGLRRNPFFVCELTVEGLNLERLLHLLQSEGVPLLAAQREASRRIRLLCYESDRKAVAALLEQKGWTLRGCSSRRLSRLRERLWRRKLLLIAAVICLCGAMLGLQFVWNVSIRGARAYQGDIRAYLTEQGIRPGVWKYGLDLRALENGLYLRYPDVVWASVYLRGVTLTLHVRLGDFSQAESIQPGDLVASRDGIVTAVLAESGTAQVQPGDIVRAGQVLISGEERDANDQTRPVRARGQIMARVWESAEAATSLYQYTSEPTGRAREWTRLCTPWFCWPQDASETAFLTYDRELRATPVVGCFFPVWLERGMDAEVALRKTSRSVEAARAEAAQAAERILLGRLRTHEIIDKWADYCMIEGGKVSAIVTAELLADIAIPANEWNGGTLIDPNTGIP